MASVHRPRAPSTTSAPVAGPSTASSPSRPRRTSSTARPATVPDRDVDAWLRDHGYQYTQTNSASLDCPICRSPFVQPMVTPCDHVFCQTCIDQALDCARSCPTCRAPISSSSAVVAAPRILTQMVDELEVACSHASLGCPFVGSRYTLRPHLIANCAFIETTCPCSRQGCASVVRKQDLPAHLAACPFSLVPCPMSCGVHVRRAELDGHLERDCARSVVDCPHCSAAGLTRDMLDEHIGQVCLEAPVECPHARFGCRWRGVRRVLLDEHIDPDVNACPYEAIKGFLFAYDARMAAADEENAALRRRVAELEQRQTATALEALACRNSLGAFALPVTRLPPSEMDDSEPPRGSVSPVQPLSSLPSPSVQLSGSSASDLPPFAHPAQRAAPIEDLWSGVRVGAHAHFVGAHSQYDPGVVGSSSDFQPFDSLPSTITRLSSSLHTLEGSIERLEVRHEVGVLDETVRLQEEVQSLRAAVHGLRLQGAWLMMERERERDQALTGADTVVDGPPTHLTDAMAAAAARRRAFALGFGSAVPAGPAYFDHPRGPPGHPRRLGLERQDTKL